jgi:hypothetical protein
MEDKFIPTENRFEDAYLTSIPENLIYKLAKEKSNKRIEQDKISEKFKCHVCRHIINYLTALICDKCRFLTCLMCYKTYQKSDQAR